MLKVKLDPEVTREPKHIKGNSIYIPSAASKNSCPKPDWNDYFFPQFTLENRPKTEGQTWQLL